MEWPVLSLPHEELGGFHDRYSSVGREGLGTALKLGYTKAGTSNLKGEWQYRRTQGDDDILVFWVECNGSPERRGALLSWLLFTWQLPPFSAKNKSRRVGFKALNLLFIFKVEYDQDPHLT